MVLIKNTNLACIEKALAMTNEKFAGNVAFNRCERTGKHFNVTLKVNDSHAPGHSRGLTYKDNENCRGMHFVKGRHLTSACWHVHGVFFDALLKTNSETVIISRGMGRDGNLRIDKDGGNWQDSDVGSQISPFYASEKCDCEE